jgi:hypothetical protein
MSDRVLLICQTHPAGREMWSISEDQPPGYDQGNNAEKVFSNDRRGLSREREVLYLPPPGSTFLLANVQHK